jgi:hypothetical protein
MAQRASSPAVAGNGNVANDSGAFLLLALAALTAVCAGDLPVGVVTCPFGAAAAALVGPQGVVVRAKAGGLNIAGHHRTGIGSDAVTVLTPTRAGDGLKTVHALPVLAAPDAVPNYHIVSVAVPGRGLEADFVQTRIPLAGAIFAAIFAGNPLVRIAALGHPAVRGAIAYGVVYNQGIFIRAPIRRRLGAGGAQAGGFLTHPIATHSGNAVFFSTGVIAGSFRAPSNRIVNAETVISTLCASLLRWVPASHSFTGNSRAGFFFVPTPEEPGRGSDYNR